MANKLGIADVRAEQTPRDKQRIIDELKRDGHVVARQAMVSTMLLRSRQRTWVSRWERALM